MYGNIWISNKISLKFVPKGPFRNIPALVQIMAWRRPGDKPLSEPMMVRLPTHICVTRPQWVSSHHMFIPMLTAVSRVWYSLCHYLSEVEKSRSLSMQFWGFSFVLIFNRRLNHCAVGTPVKCQRLGDMMRSVVRHVCVQWIGTHKHLTAQWISTGDCTSGRIRTSDLIEWVRYVGM